MAVFNDAYKITMGNEGGYANDPNDHGGETWKGVARHFWPEWKGWVIVDEIKSTRPHSLSSALSEDEQLQELVLAFYKKNFWDCLSLDSIRCQQIANELFDISVNMGSKTAARFLQTAINFFTSHSLAVDEKVGPLTVNAANNLDDCNLFDQINQLRKDRYEAIIRANPSQERFRNAWFSRMRPFKPETDGVA